MKTLQELEDSYYDSGAYKVETFSDYCDSYADYMDSIAEDSERDEE